ncbi:hypothetical protein CHISP_3578 [Chitinispirillum alkaliphilum]|nr:hypothetical protein CHISP_3578 [Chitinispirillum alkaliphilum]
MIPVTGSVQHLCCFRQTFRILATTTIFSSANFFITDV